MDSKSLLDLAGEEVGPPRLVRVVSLDSGERADIACVNQGGWEGEVLDLGDEEAEALDLVISAESREDPADRVHRHAQERADATLRRWKDSVRFVMSAMLMPAVGGLATYMALWSSLPDERGWGRTVLASLLSAIAGYFIGKKE